MVFYFVSSLPQAAKSALNFAKRMQFYWLSNSSWLSGYVCVRVLLLLAADAEISQKCQRKISKDNGKIYNYYFNTLSVSYFRCSRTRCKPTHIHTYSRVSLGKEGMSRLNKFHYRSLEFTLIAYILK